MTYSAEDADSLHADGRYFGQSVVRIINQIYPQANADHAIDETIETIFKIGLDCLRKNPAALAYIEDFNSGARIAYRTYRLKECV